MLAVAAHVRAWRPLLPPAASRRRCRPAEHVLMCCCAALTAEELAEVDAALSAPRTAALITSRLLNPGAWIRPEEVPDGWDMAQGLYRGPGSLLLNKL